MCGMTLGVKEGNQLTVNSLTAFGEPLSTSPMEDSFFTGKPHVGEMGYVFLFRAYRADQGKWQTSDPLGYPDGWNNFAYVKNAVARNLDPLGLWYLSADNSKGHAYDDAYIYNETINSHLEKYYVMLLKASCTCDKTQGTSITITTSAQTYVKSSLYDSVLGIQSAWVTESKYSAEVSFKTTYSVDPLTGIISVSGDSSTLGLAQYAESPGGLFDSNAIALVISTPNSFVPMNNSSYDHQASTQAAYENNISGSFSFSYIIGVSFDFGVPAITTDTKSFSCKIILHE